MLATPPDRLLIRRPSSSRVTTENVSRCYSHTSSAFCGWVACGCAVLVARKMSSRSALSRRTCDGSPNWSPDHHQRSACVLRSVRQYGVKAAASSGSKEIASAAALLIPEFCNKIGTELPFPNVCFHVRSGKLSGRATEAQKRRE